MTMEFGVCNSKVCKTGGGVWKYKMAVKSIVKVIGSREVVMTIEKPIGFVVEETCLAGHGEKSDPFTDTL